MTEAEWLNTSDACSLLQAAKTLSTERKFRLFACAWARSLFPPDVHPDNQHGIEVAEQIADEMANPATVNRMRELFGSLGYVGDYLARGFVGENMFIAAVVREAIKPHAQQRARIIALLSDYEADLESENDRHCGLEQAREIFGNPFRPVIFSPEWRTSTVLALSQQMYESRDFSAMSILADALQDAGCEDAAILDHCRDPQQVHVRGCWVCDCVLCKE